MKFSAVALTPLMAVSATALVDKLSSLVSDASSAVGGASGIASISDHVTSLIGSATATGTDTALSTGDVQSTSSGEGDGAVPTAAVAIGAMMGGAAILVNM